MEKRNLISSIAVAVEGMSVAAQSVKDLSVCIGKLAEESQELVYTIKDTRLLDEFHFDNFSCRKKNRKKNNSQRHTKRRKR